MLVTRCHIGKNAAVPKGSAISILLLLLLSLFPTD